MATAVSRSASATSTSSRGSFEFNEDDLEGILSGRHGHRDDWCDIDMELTRLCNDGEGAAGGDDTSLQVIADWVSPVQESSMLIEDGTDVVCYLGAIVPYGSQPGAIAAHAASESMQGADSAVLDHVLERAKDDAVRRMAVKPICAAVGYLSKQLPKQKREKRVKNRKPNAKPTAKAKSACAEGKS